MNRFKKGLIVGSLVFCLLAFLLADLSANARPDRGLFDGSYGARLDAGLVRGRYDERTSALSKRSLFLYGRTSEQAKRKSSLAAELFKNNCARCHGMDGRGDTELGRTYQTPDLTDPGWWRKNTKLTSTANLVSIVSKGRGGMPAFGKKLKRSEIRMLVGYARKFRTQKSANR